MFRASSHAVFRLHHCLVRATSCTPVRLPTSPLVPRPLSMSTSRPSRTSAKRKAPEPSPEPDTPGESSANSDDEFESKKAKPKRPPVKKTKSAPALLTNPTAPKVKATKSAAAVVSTTKDSDSGMPTNKVLPTKIEFTPREPGTLRLVTWNVAGLAASQKKVHNR